MLASWRNLLRTSHYSKSSGFVSLEIFLRSLPKNIQLELNLRILMQRGKTFILKIKYFSPIKASQLCCYHKDSLSSFWCKRTSSFFLLSTVRWAQEIFCLNQFWHVYFLSFLNLIKAFPVPFLTAPAHTVTPYKWCVFWNCWLNYNFLQIITFISISMMNISMSHGHLPQNSFALACLFSDATSQFLVNFWWWKDQERIEGF